MKPRPHVWLALSLCALLLVPGAARAATEWVLILDNSASMASGSTLTRADGSVIQIPASDPDRLTVLATLIFRSLLDPDDHLTILVFKGPRVGEYRELATDPDQIRGLVYDQSTPFTGPLRRAREILLASTRANRILLLMTDGAPSPPDELTAEQARALLGLDAGRQPFEVISLGLSNAPEMAELQRQFLGGLGNLRQINAPRDVVAAFTDIYAASIRSRPQTGRLARPGDAYSFPVGRYVTQVLVAAVSEGRTGPFDASVLADGAPVSAGEESGDNGCRQKPCHAYRVFKLPHDPAQSSRYTISLGPSAGAVDYGVIVRYDLAAEILRAPSTARVGDDVEVSGRLVWRGQTFNDAEFFASDDFQAAALLGETAVPLRLQPDGSFVTSVKIAATGRQKLRLRFTNRWLALTASADLEVNDWLPLRLVVRPDPVDFGAWTGERGRSERCVDVDLTGSLNADRIPIQVTAGDLPDGARLEAADPLAVQNDRARVCLSAPGCCGSERAPAGGRLTFSARDPYYAAGAVSVGLAYAVSPTPFWTCWWRIIVGGLAGITLLIIVIGFVRPRDFTADDVIHLAKTEAALARAAARRFRDLPGGRRGFYRDARVAFDGAGNASRDARAAAFVIRAAPHEPLVVMRSTVEQKDPRTRKWIEVPRIDAEGALRKGIVYRTGDFFFRLA